MCLSSAQTFSFTFPGPGGADPRFILGLRALASIPDSAACIILARCPDYASAASLAPLDGVSFLLVLLVFFIYFLAGHNFGVTDSYLH